MSFSVEDHSLVQINKRNRLRRSSARTRALAAIQKFRSQVSSSRKIAKSLREGTYQASSNNFLDEQTLSKTRSHSLPANSEYSLSDIFDSLGNSISKTRSNSLPLLKGDNDGNVDSIFRRGSTQSFKRDSINYERRKSYGNLALEYDVILNDLRLLQTEILSKFMNIISCEAADIFFLHATTRNLMLFHKNRWMHIPLQSSIIGECVMSGKSIHVENVYDDPRYNKDIDKATGLFTRDLICEPVRQRTGGVIGVIRMINKNDHNGFDSSDQNVLRVCVQKVSDILSNRFQDVMAIADEFYKQSEHVAVIAKRNESKVISDTLPNLHFPSVTETKSIHKVRNLTMDQLISEMSNCSIKAESMGFCSHWDDARKRMEWRQIYSQKLHHMNMIKLRKLSTASAKSTNLSPVRASTAITWEPLKRDCRDDDEEKEKGKIRWTGKIAKIVGETTHVVPQPRPVTNHIVTHIGQEVRLSDGDNFSKRHAIGIDMKRKGSVSHEASVVYRGHNPVYYYSSQSPTKSRVIRFLPK